MKKAPRPQTTGSAGFSTLEALVALLLIAVVGLAAVQAVAGGSRASSAARLRGASSVRLLQLDAALRRAAGAVVLPYWSGPLQAAVEGGAVSLPYVGGEQERSLRVSASDGWVVIETDGSQPLRLGPFAEASVAPVYDAEDLWGLQVVLRLRQGMEPVELRARIGSRAVAQGALP